MFKRGLQCGEVAHLTKSMETLTLCECKADPRWRELPKGDVPRTDHRRRFTRISRAGNPKRKRPNCHCKTPRSRGVGTPSWTGPLTTSLRGLWVSGYLPRAMVERAEGAATLEPTKRPRGRLGPRAGIPKRLRPNCHSCPRGTQRPQCAKGKGPENPGVAAPLAAAGCRGNCRRDGRAQLEHLPYNVMTKKFLVDLKMAWDQESSSGLSCSRS